MPELFNDSKVHSVSEMKQQIGKLDRYLGRIQAKRQFYEKKLQRLHNINPETQRLINKGVELLNKSKGSLRIDR